MMPESKKLEIEFNKENAWKKNIAQSARKRVGRRRGCDFIPRTNAELRAMSGPCITYHLNEPMKWSTFTQTPKHIQAEYLRSLAARFHATESMLPSLLGATPTAVRTYLANRGLSGVMALACGDQVPDMDAWTTFTNQLWHPEEGMSAVAAVSVHRVDRKGRRVISHQDDTKAREELSKSLHELLNDFESKEALAQALDVSRMLIARGLRKTLSTSSTERLLDKVRTAPAAKKGDFVCESWTKVSEVTMPVPGGVTVISAKEPDPASVLSLSGTVKNVMETIRALLSRKNGEELVTISIHTTGK